MVDDSDQPTASAARKAVLRSPSPDSPLPKDPAAAASATPCGGSVELQRLRSHVLSIEALGSSGSSSDEDQEASESVQSAARTQQAAAPPDPQAGTCGPDACSSVQTSVAEMVSAAHEAPDVARSNSAGEASRTLDAVREVLNHGLDAKPPLIRHGGGALAGLLDSPEADFHAEAAEATAERFRRATGSLHRPAAAGDAADDARCGSAQRVPFASGKKRVGGWGPGAGLMNSSGQSQRPWPACTGPQQSSVGPQRLQQEHEQQLSDRAGRSGGGTTDDVELVQRQDRSPAEDMHEGTGVPQPGPVPLGLPGVRRTLSAPPSAGATTLPPSMPSLPQLRSSRPGSSSFGRSLSQSGSEPGNSPSRRLSETVGEAAGLRTDAVSQQRALAPPMCGSSTAGAPPTVAELVGQPGDAGGAIASVATATDSPLVNSNDLASGSAPQQSAVAKAERRAARVRRRQLRESRRAGDDASPDRDPFRSDLWRQPLAAQPDGLEVELVECLSSSCPAPPVPGSARATAHARPEFSPSPQPLAQAAAGAQPHISRAASEQGSAAVTGRTGPADHGGIELPEQTYSQTLERTVERLRRELYDSQQENASLESSLRCKEQEGASLTHLVRELTVARAKAASARHHLQERHHELLEDYGRQARVVEMTRQMQKDANLAVADAQHAAREAEDKCALVRRVALQLQERSRALAAENASLRSQVTSLERLTMMQYGGGGQSACMAAYNQLRCAETY